MIEVMGTCLEVWSGKSCPLGFKLICKGCLGASPKKTREKTFWSEGTASVKILWKERDLRLEYWKRKDVRWDWRGRNSAVGTM